MRDRERLADSGFFVAVVMLDDDGQMVEPPELVSRGFVYLEEAGELLGGAEEAIDQAIRASGRNRDQLCKRIEQALARYLYGETGRRPMVHVIIR
jgi:ribonuclease J